MLDYANSKNSCGQLQINYCIRLSKGNSKTSSEYTYIQIPPIEFILPCPDETFRNISISSKQQNNQEDNSVEQLLIKAPNLIKEVSLSSFEDCREEDQWFELNDNSIEFSPAIGDSNRVVYAKFKDIFGNESQCLAFNLEAKDQFEVDNNQVIEVAQSAENSQEIIKDTSPPIATTINISDSDYTVTLINTLHLSAEGATEMYISNTPSCSSGGIWEQYSTTKTWTLAGNNSLATVFVKYRDSAGNESPCINDTIIHDDEAPSLTSISINFDADYSTSSSIVLSLAAIGATNMYITNSSGCSNGGTWESYATAKDWILEQLNATATVYIKFRDTAGNESPCINDTITHDDTVPSATSIAIGSGAYTSALANTLFPSAVGAAEMYITNTSGCSAGGTWETYAPTITSWILAQSNGTATVYAKFRDEAGNESSCINDAITHDNVAPSEPSNFDYGKTTHSASDSPTFSWTASMDPISGISRYEISIGTNPGSTNIKTWTDVGNVTNASFNDLNLALGNTYYTNIRAVDNAINTSNEVNSDTFLYGYLQQAYIKASNNDPMDKYGKSVAIDGNTIVVSAENEDSNQPNIINGVGSSSNNSSLDSGAVYVYKKTGSTWVQEAYIKAANNDAGDRFGHSVAISGDTIVISSEMEDSNQTSITNGSGASSDNSNTDSGAIYVYKRSGSTWTQEAYIKAPNSEAGDKFGKVVAISGDTIAVGVEQEDSNQTSITNSASASNNNSNSDSGAVYVFKRSGSTWIQEAYIKTSNSETGDRFGHSVAIDSDTIVASTEKEDSNQTTITNGSSASNNNSSADSGAVYVFKRSGSTWTQEAYIKAANNDANDKFGHYVDISNDTIVVTAEAEDSSQTTITNGTSASNDNSNAGSGAIYIYKRTGANWAQEAYIKAANSEANDKFGHSISISGDLIVTSAEREDSNLVSITNGSGASNNNSKTDSGGVYVYKRTGNTWAQIAYIKASNSDTNDKFGKDVSISGETIVVSSEFEDSNQTSITNDTSASSDNSSTDSGAIYVFE